MIEQDSTHLRLEVVEGTGHESRATDRRRRLSQAESSHSDSGYNGEAVTEPSLSQLLSILARRRNLIAGLAIFGTLLLTLAAMLIPPKYTAMSQIEVLPPWGDRDRRAAEINPQSNQMRVDTHLVMLKDRDFLRKVLAASPGLKTDDAELAIDNLERRITVSQSLRSSIIAVRVTLPDAQQAADVANLMANLYREAQLARKVAYRRRELKRLNDKIAQVRDLMRAEPAVIRGEISGSRSVDPKTGVAAANIGRAERAEAAKVNAQLMIELLRQRKELHRQAEAVSPDVRIVSLATPPVRPSSLHPALFIVPGAIFLLMASCFLAIAFEYSDQGLRSTQQVHRALSIPCLGLVPRIGGFGFTRPYKYLKKQPFSPYAEAIRAVAARLGFAHEAREPEVILVSCSHPGEGKTTLAVSLAQYAASIGRRVLLVDLDVMTPEVGQELKLVPGHSVVDLVIGNVATVDAIQSIPSLGFDVLPMTSELIDPVSLISSSKLKAALRGFQARYDIVLIDGPPALGRAETGLIAGLADRVLFVVKWGATRRLIAQNAVRSLRAARAEDEGSSQKLFAVVTQVPLQQHAEYRFGDAIEVTTRYGPRLLPPRRLARLADTLASDARILKHLVTDCSDWVRMRLAGLAGWFAGLRHRVTGATKGLAALVTAPVRQTVGGWSLAYKRSRQRGES